MGVVALGVAMIPLLGAGGFRLIKAEASGPDKSKFTASITTTAKVLWSVYLGMTLVATLLLWRAGLDPVDSMAHAFSALGTGGFSTRNASVGAFALPEVEWITAVFMLLSTVSFVMYCRLFTGRLQEVWRNTELRVFLAIVAFSAAALYAAEAAGGGIPLRTAVFQTVSHISSSGFMSQDYTRWSPASQIILLLLAFVGGCSGSTAGGVKVVRWTILAKQFVNEIRRLVHPYGVYTLRLNGIAGRESLVPTVAAFVFAYFALVALTAVFGAVSGLDPFTAFTAAASMAGNVGPAFGALGPAAHYGDIPDPLKWWYMLVMLAGRLEIYTLLIMAGNFARRLSGGGKQNQEKGGKS
jgi:trk system potassium uptake protein TrkH